MNQNNYLLRSSFFAVLYLYTTMSNAQNVGIGTPTPHASAQLDIVSNNRGLAIPSLTTLQRTGIASPKAGLFVFDTDRQTLCMFNGSNWVYFQSSVEPNVVHPVEQVASDGEVGDQFGYSVAINGNYAIVGAPYDNIGANSDQGSAYIFFFNGTSWVEQAKLVASGGSPDDNFGFSVAINGDYAIVGAPYDNVGIDADQGSAYIFTRSGINWTQQASITGSSATAGDNFGHSVSIDGAYAAIGAPRDDVGANNDQGTAYVFFRTGISWAQQDYVTLPSGAAGDRFGHAVSLSGNFLVAGAPNDDVTATIDAGSVHFFTRSGTDWSHEQVLTYTNNPNYHFGNSVSVSGDRMAAGSPGEGNTGYTGSGRAYFHNGSTWETSPNGNWLNTLLGMDNDADERFGCAVSVAGNSLIVGAYLNNDAANLAGRAYLIQTDGTDWYFVRYIIDPLGGPTQLAGYSVGASASTVVVGVPFANGQRGKVLLLRL